MANVVEIARLRLPPPGAAILVTIDQTIVAVFNVGGTLLALDDACVRCAHSLASGEVRAGEVKCAGCDWRYDLATGCVNGVPALRIDTYEVSVIDPAPRAARERSRSPGAP